MFCQRGEEGREQRIRWARKGKGRIDRRRAGMAPVVNPLYHWSGRRKLRTIGGGDPVRIC